MGFWTTFVSEFFRIGPLAYIAIASESVSLKTLIRVRKHLFQYTVLKRLFIVLIYSKFAGKEMRKCQILTDIIQRRIKKIITSLVRPDQSQLMNKI
jgi:hypothetical protein